MLEEARSTVLLTLSPIGKRVTLPLGANLLEALRGQKVDTGGLCGGRGKCAKCKIRVLKGGGEPTALERELLGEEELSGGWRLACRTALRADAEVLLPPTPQKLLDPQFIEPLIDRRGEPVLREVVVEVGGVGGRSYEEGVRQALAEIGVSVAEESLQALRGLGMSLSRVGPKLRCFLYGGRLLEVRPYPGPPPYALALDIGTTTLSVALLDLEARVVVDISTRRNPQSLYGADVISRIAYASRSPEHLLELHHRLLSALNASIAELAGNHRLSGRDILLATVVGNPVMHHLLFGLEVKQMGSLPFSPVVSDQVSATAAEVGLRLGPSAPVIGLPLLSGFVGADTVGMILATDLLNRRETVLAIDVGTNGEIVLLHEGELYVCSTAAGPAFEGSEIACGMQATSGAIVKVAIDLKRERFDLTTVGDGTPLGLAGTGVIDAIAELLRAKVLDPSGRMRQESLWPRFLRGRLMEAGGNPGFLLARDEEGRPIYLSQADVRQVQLAKAAIATGASLLLREVGIDPQQLDRVLIAGAFGSYIDPRTALRIGLLPPVAAERVQAIGNAALGGAILSAFSSQQLARAREIKEKAQRLELSTNPSFEEEFVSRMGFTLGRKI